MSVWKVLLVMALAFMCALQTTTTTTLLVQGRFVPGPPAPAANPRAGGGVCINCETRDEHESSPPGAASP
uniref:Uncharacterized protein n=1 Tax=Oryza brachyantha TaxID=4533 RepID=J3N528_ORYBR